MQSALPRSVARVDLSYELAGLRLATWLATPMSKSTSPNNHPAAHDLVDDQATAVLLDRVRAGDELARERLMERFLPLLRRWARGRLPAYARAAAETDDLVQVTLMRALANVARFDSRGEGAFLGYLRHILLNTVRDEIRRAGRRPPHDPVVGELSDATPSAVERAIGRQAMERYERALAALEPRQREAVLLRVEFGYPYARIAEAVACPSANGARMLVSRALARMAEEIGR